ncbi:MAG: hypothetical protein KDB37_19540, partial [Ilumatobacter sp.]|nr:hypothetical protein [Ilumatobacter sp.]
TLLGNFIMNDPTNSNGNVDSGSVRFDSTVDGAHQIVINLFGTATFNGAIGATTPLQAIQVRGVDGVFLNGGAVTNSRLQTWFGDVVLEADTVLTSTGDTDISFTGAYSLGSAAGGSLDGAFALTVNTGGATNFFTPVGATTPLTSITTDAAGTTVFTGAAITLSGNTATFNDAVILTADTLITDAGGVSFNNTVDGAFGLTVDAGGDVTFGDVVGGATPLASLSVGTDGAIIFADPITTADGAVTFEADTMAIAAAIDAGTGIVTLRPRTAGREIDLGTETATSLSLTDAELDLITAGILRIGSATAGSITFTDLISPALTDTLSLITGDQILDDHNVNAADVQVANLALQSVNGIANNELLETLVDTVAALNTTDGGIAILERFAGGDLIVGTVDGVVGLRNEATGANNVFNPTLAIQLETTDGNLTVNDDIYNSRRNICLVAQQGNGGAGDSLFTNNANIVNGDGGGNANNAQIDIRANNMTLAAGSTISAANRVILEDDPSSSSTIAINLGGADGVNTLGLTDAELDTVTTAGVLQIGHPDSGDITVLDRINPANVSTVDLETGGKVLDGDAFSVSPIEVTNLAIRAGTGIGTALDDLDVEVSNLAFSNAAGLVSIQGFTDMTIAAVDGLATSSNAGTTTAIEILSGELTFAVDTSSTGDATFTVPIITVGNSVTVNTSPAGTLAFNATTVNLDGNLSAVADGITGTATTVNVIGSTGGAELQDAVDVAAAGATVNVGDGTFAGNVAV